MALYVSSPKQLGLQLIQGDKIIAKFQPVGKDFGEFFTENEKTIAVLEAHPEFGKRFYRFEGQGIPVFKEKFINHGILSSAGELTVDEKEQLRQKAVKEVAEDVKNNYLRYGELKNKLLNREGEFKKNASKSDINEFNKLKELIGE